MARISESELERLKREASEARLAEARGVKLQRHGADFLGLCPFHDDHEPSLVISPAKNLCHCVGACQTGGTAIDWVMRAEGMSFRHAVEWLRGAAPAAGEDGGPAAMAGMGSVTPRLAVEARTEDSELLDRAVRFYQATLSRARKR